MPISDSAFEDLVDFLIGHGYEAARKYNGHGRLNGYVLSILHFRATDWTRHEFGSTRDGRRRLTFEPYDAELHDRPGDDDDPSDVAGRELDADALSAEGRGLLENIIRPIVASGETQVGYAGRMGVPVSRVVTAFRVVRAELEALELEPTNRQ